MFEAEQINFALDAGRRRRNSSVSHFFSSFSAAGWLASSQARLRWCCCCSSWPLPCADTPTIRWRPPPRRSPRPTSPASRSPFSVTRRCGACRSAGSPAPSRGTTWGPRFPAGFMILQWARWRCTSGKLTSFGEENLGKQGSICVRRSMASFFLVLMFSCVGICCRALIWNTLRCSIRCLAEMLVDLSKAPVNEF